MASSPDQNTDMDYQNISLPSSGRTTPEPLTGPTSCARLEVTKADIRRFTLIVQGYDNMITSLKHSNAQDEHDPTFVEMVKQRSYYENRLEKAVSEFGNLPYCDTPGCPIHETPTASPVKPIPTKRKDEDGFTSPPPSKTSKNNVSPQESFKLNLANRFNNLKPQDTETAGTSRNINVNTRNTTLQPKANPATNNLPPPVFLVFTENHRTQMKKLNDIYPDLRSCPKFPKPRKGSNINTNTYTNTVNSIIRPGISFAQAASTSNAQTTQQMAPRDKRNPAVSVTNQASQSNVITPPINISNNNGAFDINFITQTLQQTILALTMLTQQISNIPNIPPPTQPKKSKKALKKKELSALFEALMEDYDD
ncbi:hypothetical protein TNIN_403331 [Trichonephila inaurata madagascariensis]|uniref:Uncharacterized protein n=2 Tax=Trichonephila inaurata madagascariensis TaxID=2747483 RepID=A0A8X7C2J0_9ARAC|nr:hypothetical protein TNIN_403331 [Trichonephila inaurata madagascariensis]